MALLTATFATVLILITLITSNASHFHFRHTSGSAASCTPPERDALLDFKKHALQNDPHGHWFSSWADPRNSTNTTTSLDSSSSAHGYDCCAWEGVICDPAQGFVTDIDLNNCNGSLALGSLQAEMMMTPEAVQALAAIPHLSRLFLGCQRLMGSIPPEISNLTSLVSLHLEGNMLSGVVPPSIQSLKSLQELDLSNNQFPLQPIPSCVLQLPSLIYLDLSYNNFEFDGDIPDASFVMNLTQIQHLDLSHNYYLSGLLPPWMQYMTSLVDLLLSSNSLSGAIPADVLLNLTRLQLLDLSSNRLTGAIRADIFTKLAGLKELDFSFNSLTGPVPACMFMNLARLQVLDLSSNSLTGAIPADMFMNLSEMDSLDLSHNRLDGPLPTSVQYFNPSFIDLSFNELTGAIPNVFANLTKLQDLDLSNNRLDGLLPSSMQNLTSLQFLHLYNNHFLPQEIPSFILSLPSITNVDLSCNSFIGAIPNVNTSGSNIQYLSLSHNQLDRLLPFHMQQLDVLRLDNNQFPSQQVPPFLFQLPGLELLDLSVNNFTGVSGFPVSNTYTSPLVYLNLSSNQIARIFYASIFPVIKNLVVLDLSDNMLGGPFPTSFIPTLEVLNMNGNKIRGSIPSFIRSLQEIRVLDLGSNELNGSIPEWIGANLKRLQILVLADNHFTGIVPANLGLLTAMRISGDEFSGVEFSTDNTDVRMDITVKGQTRTFYDLAILSVLDLSSNQLQGPIPPELGNLTFLASLNLSGNHLEGEIPYTLGDPTNLESLDLSRNRLQGQIPGSLGGLQSLGFLNLSSNHLRGSIPSTPLWLDTFNASCFLDNDGLCSTSAYSLAGLPVCGGDSAAAMTDSGEASRDVEGGVESKGFGVGYPLGLVLGTFFSMVVSVRCFRICVSH